MATTSRLRRPQRREQILDAATGVFARAGFAAVSVDDVAAAAGISRAILYRHFDAKTDLYRAALDRARSRLAAAVGEPDYTGEIIDALLAAADADPDGFRLLFRQAPREPGFRAESEDYERFMVEAARRQLAGRIPDPGWADWAARLTPTATVEAIVAWLDAGRPDPATAADRIRRAIAGVVDAAGRAAE